jgi:beta-glucuronidase
MVKENIMPSNKYKPPSSHSCNWRNATLCDLSIAVVLLAACWGLVSFGFEEHVAKHLRVSVPKSSNSGISAQTSPFPPSYWPKFRGQRYVTLLDGMWETANVSSQKDLDIFDSMNPNFDPCTINFSELMPVPSCVDRSPPGFMIPRGVYFFRRNFHFDLAPAGARLQFQGCSFYCRVWVNGKEIGDHLAGGYVAFTLDIPPQPSVDNDIFVLVDDRFNKTTAPMHTGGDFFHYGGIMRSVELHALPPRRGSASTQSLWPWRIYVIPNSLKSANITLHLTDRTYTGPIDAEIKVSFDEGPAVAYAPSTFSAINGVADLGNMDVPNPRVWSTVDPQLHTLLVEIDGAVLVERFGLRLFDIDESSLRIRLNGEVIKLLGWGHHTQWPDTAGSPTDEQLDEDILLLKAAGANFVRGAHYPQDARWLDRLDENGMVMWCETLGPNVSATDTIDPHFLKYQSQQMNEMLDNAMNHASVGIWAYFNEGPSGNNASCTAYQMNTDIIKSRDTSRLVSYASSEAPPKDVCYHAVDVVSINGYPEWVSWDF